MKAGIIGISGYTGLELIRLIQQHPHLEVGTVYSSSMNKKTFQAQFSHLQQPIAPLNLTTFNAQQLMKDNDLLFFATPSGISKDLVAPFVENNFPVIDLSGDLRLKNPELYQKWYQKAPAKIDILRKFEYCLPEWHAPTGNFIANPGCFATAASLALMPLVKDQLIEFSSIVIDAKSGLSGAGKKLADTSHFVNVAENMSMYKVNQHQHIPEIIQFMQKYEKEFNTLQFTTSLIPIKRGIFLSLYAKVAQETNENALYESYLKAYQKQPFVRIQKELPQIRQVLTSNFCDIGLRYNPQTHMVTVVSVIDNLVKGAAGQAIQNFNLWADLESNCGLEQIPIFP